MKELNKRSSYISAYPLKVLEQAQAAAPGGERNDSTYLRNLMTDRAKTISRIRISPMSDPYKAPATEPQQRIRITSQTVLPEGKEWFNHYE